MVRASTVSLAAFVLLALGVARGHAQTGDVSGRVVDEEGRPLPAATVRLDSPGVVSLSNSEGMFLFRRVPVGTQTIDVSYTGYQGAQERVEVRAGAVSDVTVTLSTSVIALDELTVYGAASRGQAQALQRQKTSSTIASAQLNGLSARREREMLGEPGSAGARVQQWEEYGPYGTVSLQYSLR